jgi:Uncharacterized protein conserved in bacteria
MHDSSANILGDALGCGARLREARESAGLGLPEVASRLRMPLHVVEALEEGRWEVIGATVFVRGQLRSYAKLLGIDIEPFLETTVAPAVPVELVSHAHTPRYQRWVENMGRRMVYGVITIAIAVPVWLATRSHLTETPPATASLDAVPPALVADAPAQSSLPAPPPAQPETSGPYMASLAPAVGRAATAPVDDDVLQLEFSGESWMQVSGRDGRVVEQGLMRAGESRRLDPAAVGSVVLGNASVVRVQQSGSIVDLTPYQRANVARFAVSSDGSVTAAE